MQDRLFAQLSRKAAKLQPYRANGMTTVLLVESNDMALMSHEKMFEVVQSAFDGRTLDGVVQLWYVDTSIEPDLEFWDLTPALGMS